MSNNRDGAGNPCTPDRLSRLNNAALLVITILSGGIFWLSPHPPMIDVPQHAGQVALILDLISSTPHWQDTFYINYFTPYLLGYGLWTLLALLMPMGIALKLLLTTAFWGFVYAGRHLRRQCHADDRLDWLLLPAFFGFSFKWGFLTFLMAAPLGMLFLSQVMRYSQAPALRTGLSLFLAGLALFFCHGLVFLLCMVLGGLFALGHARSVPALMRLTMPYMALTPLAIIYYISASTNAVTQQSFKTNVLWLWDTYRAWQFMVFPVGLYAEPLTILFGTVALFAPFLLESRLNSQRMVWIPLAVILAIWLGVPHFAMKTSFLYERFSLFILPFYILMFTRKQAYERPLLGGVSSTVRSMAPGILPTLAITFMTVNALQFVSFARESTDYEEAVSHVPDGRRVLSMIYDLDSPAAGNKLQYVNYSSWYQAEHKGTVDISAAWFAPQPVRFRSDALPVAKPRFAWEPWTLNELKGAGRYYDYFFVRWQHRPASVLESNDGCDIRHVASSGKWHIYQKISCPPQTSTHASSFTHR